MLYSEGSNPSRDTMRIYWLLGSLPGTGVALQSTESWDEKPRRIKTWFMTVNWIEIQQ